MPEHVQYEDDDLFNPETHHESSDVPVKGLLWFIVIFVVFSIITWAVVLFMYKGFVNMERKRMDPPATAVTRPHSVDVPQNQPLLQPFPRPNEKGEPTNVPQHDTPVVDLIRLRESEAKVLNHYGWVDRQHGVVHIPIEEAKARFAAQAALQGQTSTAPATATTTAAPETTTTTTTAPATAATTTTGAHQ
ncbi:MAG TPA: hypothetical protein VF787_11385 [Thermoanaerobaculia bacterium]